MKTVLFVSVLLGFLTAIFTPPAWATEKIRLTIGEWMPYHSKKVEHYGVGTRIVTEAFALQGVEVEYGWFPWSRAKHLVEAGEWDGCVSWAWVAEWQDLFYFSDEPIYEGAGVFFHLKSYSFDWNNIEDLFGIPMGGILTYAYPGIPNEYLESGDIDMGRAPSELQNFKMLLSGRIKLFPENIDVGYHIIKQNFPEETVKRFTHHPKPLQHYTYHMILSKKIARNAQMMALFNKGLKQLKQSGRYDEIFAESGVRG